jgi:hypothetical protein
MLHMVYPRRPLSGHITCYLNRTYHVLPTLRHLQLDIAAWLGQNSGFVREATLELGELIE